MKNDFGKIKMKKMIKLLLILSLPLFLILACGGGSKTPVDDDSSAVLPDSDEENNEDAEEIDEKPDEKPSGNDDDDNTGTKPESDPCKNNPCPEYAGYTGACIPDEDGKGYSCECRENYEWDGIYCTPKTRIEECSGLPQHAHWNMVSSITQKQQDGEWIPSAAGEYNRESSESFCRFICDENYFWNGSDCVNLCETEPCKNLPHSDGICSSAGAALYTCGCEEGYYWWGERLGCIARKPAFGNICSGQNECYDDLNEIECPATPDADFFGQEAQYARLGTCSPLDITLDTSNAEEPLIISRNTGFMWQKNIIMQSFPWEDAVSHCENLIYAGYDDWRLPSVREMSSILVSNKYMVEYNRTFLNFFPDFVRESGHIPFWTSDRARYTSEDALLLNFYNNEIIAYSETKPAAAICVRGEKLPGSEFETVEINGDEVVTDQATGLMWQKDSGTKSSWKQALNYCEKLVYAGFSDWRLPGRNEILSLVNYGGEASSDFPGVDDYDKASVFSSTTCFDGINSDGIIDGSDTSCRVDLHYGNADLYMKPDKTYFSENYVHCVRSEICPEGKILFGSDCLDDPCIAAVCEVSNSTGVCVPKTESSYECQCLDGFFWNGSECVDPCKINPCSKITNSDGECTAVNSSLYYCGCANGYTWTNGKCAPFATNVKNVGNICTGQDKCYDNKEEISCSGMKSKPFAGQDSFSTYYGNCQKHNFTLKTVSGENIIVDNNTKLEWQQSYPQKSFDWNEAYTYCDSLEYGGKNDWRLPAPQEIMTISDYSRTWPALDRTYFTETPEKPTDSRNFWTDDVSILSVNEGYIFSYPSKDDIYFVMCVRGKKLPTANLSASMANDDKIVKDLSSGLTWTLNDAATDKWEDALSYCLNLTYAGYSKWRLPSKNELVSLVSFDGTLPAEFSERSDFWSSTTYPYSIEYVVHVNLNGGFDYILKNQDIAYPVICVGNFE